MAKQRGPLRISGTIEDLTFVKTPDGYKVRQKSSLTAEKVATDPAFLATRQNGSEFGRASSASSLFRETFIATIKGTDRLLPRRLSSLMLKILRSDQAHTRGNRNVYDGDLQMLRNFQFNDASKLYETLYAGFTPSIDRVTGELKVVIPAFTPQGDIIAPQGASWARFVSTGAEIAFADHVLIKDSAESAYIPLTSTTPTAPITLTSTVTPNSTLPLFLGFGVEFWMDGGGGVKQRMTDESYNTFGIVMIDA